MNACMSVLYVVDRVFLAMREGEINIKSELRICPTLYQKETYRIQTNPVDELAHGGVTAGALGNSDLGAATHYLYQVVQDNGRELFRDPHTHPLAARSHPRNSH